MNVSRTLKNFALFCAAFLIVAGLGELVMKVDMTVLGQAGPGGYFVTTQPNAKLPVMNFTASAQSFTRPLSGFSSATVQLYGPATAATLQCFGNNDALATTNFYALPFSAGAVPAVASTTVTPTISVVAPGAFPAYAGTPVLYYLNVAGFTNLKCTTSGTFTGASMSAQVTATSNVGVIP